MSMATVNAVNESSPASTRQAIYALAFFGLTVVGHFISPKSQNPNPKGQSPKPNL